MYARVARWEGADADRIRTTASRISEQAADGPPPGVPGKGFLLLADPDSGTTLAIGFFETKEDLETGDRALNEMNPPDDGMGSRTSVEFYEVAVDVGDAKLEGGGF